MSRLWPMLDVVMSNQTHNVCVWTCLIVWAGAVVSVLLAPHPDRLAMAKDVGVVLMGLLGIVGTAHTAKEWRKMPAAVEAPHEPA